MRLKTFEQYDTNKNYKPQLEEILRLIEEKGYEYEDLYITDKGMSFYLIDKYPFSVHMSYENATIIVEKDGVTDNLGAYNINTELDYIVEVITDFE